MYTIWKEAPKKEKRTRRSMQEKCIALMVKEENLPLYVIADMLDMKLAKVKRLLWEMKQAERHSVK